MSRLVWSSLLFIKNKPLLNNVSLLISQNSPEKPWSHLVNKQQYFLMDTYLKKLWKPVISYLHKFSWHHPCPLQPRKHRPINTSKNKTAYNYVAYIKSLPWSIAQESLVEYADTLYGEALIRKRVYSCCRIDIGNGKVTRYHPLQIQYAPCFSEYHDNTTHDDGRTILDE